MNDLTDQQTEADDVIVHDGPPILVQYPPSAEARRATPTERALIRSYLTVSARAQAAEAERDKARAEAHHARALWDKHGKNDLLAECDALAAKLRAVEALCDGARPCFVVADCEEHPAVKVRQIRAALSADTTPEATEPKCCCDGAAYYSTEQNRTRQPFMISWMRYGHGLSATPEATEQDEPKCSTCGHTALLHSVGYWGCSVCDCGALTNETPADPDSNEPKPRCSAPMRGIYGAETLRAREEGHGPEGGWHGRPDGHHPIWRDSRPTEGSEQ
jgi:hypothetical protein